MTSLAADPHPSAVRTFRGPDSRSVLAAVKAALGSDALILSSREVAGNLFRSAGVEVTAALVDEPTVSSPALSPAIANRYPAAEEVVRQDASRSALDRELQAMRTCLEETQSALTSVSRQARIGQDLQLAPAAAAFHTFLCLQGVDPMLAEELVRQPNHGSAPRSAAGFREPARQAISRLARSGPAPWLPAEHRGRRVIALVGPTGVGKTTTLAKIAARALLEHRQRVALITLDSYRIGAAEQIAHSGNLLDAPTFVARDRGELCRALGGCGEASLVLIDTAGRSNMEDVVGQAELARSIPGVELQLVLSAVTSAVDLAAIARRYRTLLPNQLIFTKVDETLAPGGLLSALTVAQRPMSCLTNGQRVPEDIYGQTDGELIDLLLGESKWNQERA